MSIFIIALILLLLVYSFSFSTLIYFILFSTLTASRFYCLLKSFCLSLFVYFVENIFCFVLHEGRENKLRNVFISCPKTK